MARFEIGGEMHCMTGITQSLPVWLKLRRMGTLVTGFASSDGHTWRFLASANVALPPLTFVGLAVSSHDTGVTNTATFDRVAVSRVWTSRDVGFTTHDDQKAGGTVYVSSDELDSVRATGADIWAAADEFHFVNAPGRGDGGIIVRVDALTARDEFAKAGVMLRESFAPDAAAVILDVRPNGELELMTRSTAGADMNFIAGGTRNGPVWLWLERRGAEVIAQVSSNGVQWSVIGRVTIALPDLVYGGPVVTSRDPDSEAVAQIHIVNGWWNGVP